MTASSTLEPRPVGRRPEADLEDRVHVAALDVYGEVGWAATNLTRIATHGGIGKSTLYKNWRTKERLLTAAFTAVLDRKMPEHRQSVRDWFIHDGLFRLETYLGPHRKAVLRLALEFTTNPDADLQSLRQNLYILPLQRTLDALREMRSRGLIPPDTSILRMADAIEGSIYNRAMWVPEDQTAKVLENAPTYVETVVDEQLGLARVPPDLVLEL